MSAPFSHIFIPLAILFIFSDELKLDPRKIVALSFFGALPDIDIFSFHRADLHNIFILVIPLLVFIFTRYKEISGIICFYLASHLILDIFDGGIYLLYPFYNNVFFANVVIGFSEANTIIPNIEYGISNHIMSNMGEPIMSSENSGIAILLIMFMLIKLINKIRQKR
jgi:hypothetical protein